MCNNLESFWCKLSLSVIKSNLFSGSFAISEFPPATIFPLLISSFVLSFCTHPCFLLHPLYHYFSYTFFSLVLHPHSFHFFFSFFALLPFLAPLCGKLIYTEHTCAAVAVCFAEQKQLSVHTDDILPLDDSNPMLQPWAPLNNTSREQSVRKKTLSGASHSAVMTVCVCIYDLCVVFVVIQMSQYTRRDEQETWLWGPLSWTHLPILQCSWEWCILREVQCLALIGNLCNCRISLIWLCAWQL